MRIPYSGGMTTTYKVILAVVALILIAIVARYTVFADEFNEWGAGLERISEWEEDYRAKNPNATDEEVDAAFRSGMASITVWIEQYKQEHPGATDAEAEAAFNAAWDN